MKKKEPQSSQNLQQTFIQRFISRCYERREIDQQSLAQFNRFVALFGQQLSKETTKDQVLGLMYIVSAVLRNFDELNKNRPTYQMSLQLIDIYLSILEKIINLGFSKDVPYDLLLLFWPIFEPDKKEFSFQDVEKKLKKINSLDELEANNSKPNMPALWSGDKYDKLVNQMLREIGVENRIRNFLKSYLMIQGQKYLDIVLKLITEAIEANNVEIFSKILKIYLSIGSTHEILMTHVEALMNKILRSKEKVQFFSMITDEIQLEKYYMPNHLLEVSLNILDCIFVEKNINDHSFKALTKIASYQSLFMKADRLVESEKLLNLPANMLGILSEGKSQKKKRKANKSKSKPKGRSKKSLSQDKSNRNRSRSRSISQEKKEVIKNFDMLSSIFGEKTEKISELEKLLKMSQQSNEQEDFKDSKMHDSSDEEQNPDKSNEPLMKKHQIEKYAKMMKKIMLTLAFKCKATGPVLKFHLEKKDNPIYKKMNYCKNVDKDSERYKHTVDFVMSVFPKLLENNPNFQIENTEPESGIVHLVKLKIIQEKKLKKMTPEAIFEQIYKPNHALLMSQKFMQNYHFLILHMAHSYLQEDIELVLDYLIDFVKSQNQNENEKAKLTCLGINLVLVNSLLENWSNIKITIPLMKDLVEILNHKFSILSFMHGSEIKENSLFISLQKLGQNNLSYQDSNEEERGIFDKVAMLLNTLIQKESGTKMSKILGQMAGNNTNKSTYYYMLIIELNVLCQQYSPIKLNSSRDFQAILNMKKNNRLGLMLTITHEIKKSLNELLNSQDIEFDFNDYESISVVFHLFKRAQYLIENPNDESSVMNIEKNKDEKSKKGYLLPYDIAKTVRDKILEFIFKFSGNISFKLYKLINQLYSGEHAGGQSLKAILDQKNQKLKEYIKDIRMIKFFAESVSDLQILVLLIVRSGVRLIEQMHKSMQESFSQAKGQNSMQQQNREVDNSEQYQKKLKSVLLLFDPQNPKCEAKEKKYTHLFVVIKLLCEKRMEDNSDNLSSQEYKNSLRILESNHEQFEQILINESRDEAKNSKKWFYEEKTGFMGYLLDNILLLKQNEPVSNKSDKQMCERFEVSICFLNMLKTLIDNNTEILKITQNYLFQKMDTVAKISQLIKGRTLYGIKMIEKIIENQRLKLTIKQEHQTEIKPTDDSKSRQIEDYLKLSKKMYTILSKVITQHSTTNSITINLNSMLQQIISLDECNCVSISLYICRQILNFMCIMKPSLNQMQKWKQISEIIFGYLMRIWEVYKNTELQSAIECRYGEMMDENAQQNKSMSISVFISYFIIEFYEFQNKTEPIVSKNAEESVKTNNFCQRNKKTVTFKCLLCESEAEFCGNCAIHCHQNHPLIFIPNGYQLSSHCECRDIDECKLVGQNQRRKQKAIKKDNLISAELKRQSDERIKQKILKYYPPAATGSKIPRRDDGNPFQDIPQRFGRPDRPRGQRIREMVPIEFMPDPNSRVSYGMMQREMFDRERFEKERMRRDREREKMRELYHRESALLGFGGGNIYDSGFGSNPFQDEKYPSENWKVPPEPENEQEDIEDFMDEDYRSMIEEDMKRKKKTLDLEINRYQNSYTSIEDHTYLLPIFLGMTTAAISKKASMQTGPNVQEITWHLKLQQPLRLNNNLISSISEGQNKHPVMKMCNPNTFLIKLRRPDASYHPSPNVSRKNFVLNERYALFLSGLNINVFHKQKILQYIQDGKNTTISYQFIYQHPLQYEAHSICLTPDGNICTAGLHHISVFGLQPEGVIDKHHMAKFSMNNDNINKIEICSLGIFVGLSREIKLFNFQLKEVAALKIPENLIKEWCLTPNQALDKVFTIYITINDGYIFYMEINSGTQGTHHFNKKINDGRMNRPVGSFVLCKNIKSCGELMFASFKDKSISHCIGRLDGTNLVNPNYIKLFNQGIDHIFDKHYCMGLTDLIESPENVNQFYMVTIFKAEINDQMSIHKGVLAIIKFTRDRKNQITKYETQFVTQDVYCEYFSILKINDKGQCKTPSGNPYWAILSIHDDGSFFVTNPFKINDQILKEQIKQLREKKNQIQKKGDVGVLNSDKNTGEKKDQFEGLKNKIKDCINLKVLKDKAKSLTTNSHYQYLSNSEPLKINQDYTFVSYQKDSITDFEVNCKNPHKIITGISLPEQGTITLNSRTITDVFDFGLTHQESLYLYAFGTLKFSFKKKEVQRFSRESIKDQLQSSMNKKRGNNSIEQRLIFCHSRQPNSKKAELMVYGQSLMPVFQDKVVKEYPDLFSLGLQQEDLFSLDSQQKIELSLKTTDIFFTNCLVTKNFQVIGEDDITEFAQCLRENMMRKKDIGITYTNKNYLVVKKVLIKSLKVLQKLRNRKFHIFNDEYHPERFATEIKLQHLYDSLNKNEISDSDLILLVEELYDMIEPQNELIPSECEGQISWDLLSFFIAKYPSMLMKIHKKFKVVESKKITQKLIPLYLLGFQVLRYLKYHTEWIFSALCEATAKEIIKGQNKTKIQCRKILYKYLKEIPKINLEGWLKNVEGIDAHQCMKQVPALSKEPSNPGRGLDFMAELASLGEIDDFEMQMKMALELSKMEMKADEPDDMLDVPIEEEQNREMEDIENKDEEKVQIVIKDLVRECLKDVDFNANSVQLNSQRVIVLYVVSKLADESRSQDEQEKTLIFIFKEIKGVMKKITENYQAAGNQNIHNVLMLWMDLFGFIFKRAKPFISTQETEEFNVYSQVKDCIMDVLKHKIRVEEIKKYHILPKMMAKLFYGQPLSTKAPLVYGLIKVLQPPCEINYVLLTLECYWLFPENKDYYNKTKYTDTIRENEKLGNIEKIHDTAITNIKLWQQVGDADWLMDWVEKKNQDWPKALKLLSMLYDDEK